jgi:hypothetical protein
MKLDLNRTIYTAEETPRLKEKKEDGTEVYVTVGDVLRAVYASTVQGDTREQKSKKGRLLKLLNHSLRKKKELALTVDDAKFTLDVAGATMETTVFLQIEDLIEGRPTLGDADPEEEEASTATEPTE